MFAGVYDKLQSYTLVETTREYAKIGFAFMLRFLLILGSDG